ncbi:PREDICTED: seipin-2-like [Camelina sativa]|uniref:Seipin-2-like n=1 Tax=Camelina sativa TaxID=90675 RepID=A0ABM0YDX0_CAMSA|nr:PREDICTED: seipin-2-like [Camelina sativa]
MESESDSNPSTTTEEEFDRFLDAPDEFYYDCFPIRSNSHPHPSLLRRRKSAHRRDSISSDRNVEKREELNNDVIESTDDLIDQSPGKKNDVDVIDDKGNDMNVIDPVLNRVDPFHEESTVTTVSSDDDDDNDGSAPQLREPSEWSLLGFLAGLVIKAIEFQISLMTSLLTFPPWLLHYCFLIFLDPFSTVRFGRRFLMARVAEISDMLFGTMNPFRLSWLNDTKRMLSVAYKFGWGMFWAVYVGIVLLALLVSSLMVGGYMINRITDEPFVVKETLNFDYTKNSPEAYVPITSCVGVDCVGSCKESNEMSKIRGLRAIPRDQKLDITLSMTLPESAYNKNLGMFQVRVDFLSADGQTISSIRRPCMLRFRSEPIRLVQTFFKVVPLVTGYVSEIQTLRLKLKGFVEKDIPTACLKIIIEQRAEFRPGAGIPELYDASLSVESGLPFFRKVIWKWRKTLFVWISMSLFITELLFTLVCCRPLIIPRTRPRNRPPSNPTTGSR